MRRTWFEMRAKGGVEDEVEISIHDEIGYWGVSARQFLEELGVKARAAKRIHLSLHSPGGEVLDGWGIYNALKLHPAEVVVTVKGLAASMASVIMLAGDVVRIPKNAYVMIHRVSGGAFGDAEDLREYAEMMEKLEDGIIGAYVERTGLNEGEIRKMVEAETWMSGEEAVEKGFADEVLEGVKAVALGRSEWKSRFGEGAPSGVFDKGGRAKGKGREKGNESDLEDLDMTEAEKKKLVDDAKEEGRKLALAEMKAQQDKAEKDAKDAEAAKAAAQKKVDDAIAEAKKLGVEIQIAGGGDGGGGKGAENQAPDVAKLVKDAVESAVKPLQDKVAQVDGLVKSGVLDALKGGGSGKAVEDAAGGGEGGDGLKKLDDAIKNAKDPLERGRAIQAKRKALEEQGK
jgi:ATP-dependent Clp endopeptidase proteolytic subunit ClpP